MKSRLLCAMCAFAFLYNIPLSARAELLNLVLDYPKIGVSTATRYDPNTNPLFIDFIGTTGIDFGNGVPENIISFGGGLSATIDEAGTLVDGTLNIGGNVASLPGTSGTLLTGDLVAFGFSVAGTDPIDPNEGGRFEFIFTATGGEAASLYEPNGGIVLDATGFFGSFDTPIFSGGSGRLGNVVVLILPAIYLFGTGLIGLIGIAKRGIQS